MPNWVYNQVSIKGPEDQIANIKKQLNQPFTMVHDNYNQDTKTWEKKEYSYSNPVFSFWNIHRPIDMETYHKQEDPNADKTKLFDGNNWYNWNVREWGTKWDVGIKDDERFRDTELVEETEGSLVYSIHTAWSPPTPAIQKLSKFVPDCVVVLTYQEEQGWGGEVTFLDGLVVKENEYDSQCFECFAENSMEYCEDCEDEMCTACNTTRGETSCTHLVEA
jgi:hypothetical protein